MKLNDAFENIVIAGDGRGRTLQFPAGFEGCVGNRVASVLASAVEIVHKKCAGSCSLDELAKRVHELVQHPSNGFCPETDIPRELRRYVEQKREQDIRTVGHITRSMTRKAMLNGSHSNTTNGSGLKWRRKLSDAVRSQCIALNGGDLQLAGQLHHPFWRKSVRRPTKA